MNLIKKEKPFYKSKKFWALISGCIAVAADEYMGIPKEDTLKIVGLIGAYILGQGAADLGKNQ